jgi:hypothetical protein
MLVAGGMVLKKGYNDPNHRIRFKVGVSFSLTKNENWQKWSGVPGKVECRHFFP